MRDQFVTRVARRGRIAVTVPLVGISHELLLLSQFFQQTEKAFGNFVLLVLLVHAAKVFVDLPLDRVTSLTISFWGHTFVSLGKLVRTLPNL